VTPGEVAVAAAMGAVAAMEREVAGAARVVVARVVAAASSVGRLTTGRASAQVAAAVVVATGKFTSATLHCFVTFFLDSPATLDSPGRISLAFPGVDARRPCCRT